MGEIITGKRIAGVVRAFCLLTVFVSAFLVQAPLFGLEATRLLSESGDPLLQQGLEELVRKQGLWAASERGELSLALVIVTQPERPTGLVTQPERPTGLVTQPDTGLVTQPERPTGLVTQPERPRLAEINGHEMVYAASLPKIAILLGAAVAIEEGRLALDPVLHKDLNDMIRHSCNECATRVLELVGRQELLNTLQSPEYKFYDQEHDGGLWVGKEYGPGTAYKRDPLSGLSHGATAFQAARFYYKLHTGTLVSAEQSEMMLETLARPGISHKFVKGLEAYDNLEIYRKSGTWKTFHADSALVRFDGHAYIMVALAHNPQGSRWLEQLAGPLHELAISHSRAAYGPTP